MSTDREVTRIVRSWLEEGVTALPDRVLDAVLDQVPATRQRRARWPARRGFDMNLPIRLAIGAAAVLVAAVIGISFLSNGSGVGGGPAATPTPAPTPTPTPIPLPVGDTGVPLVEPGTYVARAPFPIPVTVTLPAGWSGNVRGPYAIWLHKTAGGAHGGGAIALTLSQSLYADPCNDQASLDSQPGPTVDDLASALAKLPGFDVTSATEVTMDGYLGKQLTLTAPANFNGCTLSSDGYGLFQLPLGAVYSFTPGQRTALVILDVKGKRLVVSSDTYPATTAQDQAEIQAILDSIRIESPG